MKVSIIWLSISTGSGLLGLDPSLPEHLVQAIKERIVIPTAHLESPSSEGCRSSLEGPFGLRGEAVGGFLVGDFFGVSADKYFEAIGRLVGEVQDLKELQRERAEISAEEISGLFAISDFLEVKLERPMAGFSGRAKFSGIFQGLLGGENVWWCDMRGDREISDHCGYEISVFPADSLRFFPANAPDVLEISVNFRPHKFPLNQVLVGKNLEAQYASVSSGAAVTSLAEAATRKLAYKASVPVMPSFRMYEFISALTDESTQAAVERAVLDHLNSSKPLDQLLMKDTTVMRKYANFSEAEIFSQWGIQLVAQLREKDRLELLNLEITQVINRLNAFA